MSREFNNLQDALFGLVGMCQKHLHIAESFKALYKEGKIDLKSYNEFVVTSAEVLCYTAMGDTEGLKKSIKTFNELMILFNVENELRNPQ